MSMAIYSTKSFPLSNGCSDSSLVRIYLSLIFKISGGGLFIYMFNVATTDEPITKK